MVRERSEVCMTKDTTSPPCSINDGDPNERLAQLRPVLVRAAKAQSSDHHLAEDAVQITLEKLFKALIAGRIKGSLSRYARQTLSNTLIDEYRKRSRKPESCIPPEEIPERQSELGLPLSKVLAGEISIDIRKLVEELPQKQRDAIKLCVLQGFSTATAAEKMDVKEDTVKRYLKTAYRRLEKSMIDSAEEVSA